MLSLKIIQTVVEIEGLVRTTIVMQLATRKHCFATNALLKQLKQKLSLLVFRQFSRVKFLMEMQLFKSKNLVLKSWNLEKEN